jgi:hypothetical protein
MATPTVVATTIATSLIRSPSRTAAIGAPSNPARVHAQEKTTNAAAAQDIVAGSPEAVRHSEHKVPGVAIDAIAQRERFGGIGHQSRMALHASGIG